MIRIAIVDDKSLNRKSIQQKLLSFAGGMVVLSAANGEIFLDKVTEMPESERPQLVLMDIDMPGMNGIETIAIATLKFPGMKFLVLTIFDDDEKIFQAIQVGANGYLLKDDDSQDIVNAIETVMKYNGVPLSPSVARKALQWLKASSPGHSNTAGTTFASEMLSARETEVLQLMTEGLNYKAIGERLFISPLTVKTHVSRIYEKLHVNSKAQAIQLSHKMKWFS